MHYPLEGMVGNSSMCRNLIHTHHKNLFLTLEKQLFKNGHFVIFIISPFLRPRDISQLVSGLYYVTLVTGCKFHIGAKLYSFGRANVFSSVATNFGLMTIFDSLLCCTIAICKTCLKIIQESMKTSRVYELSGQPSYTHMDNGWMNRVCRKFS